MNGYERTRNFVLGKPVDRPPFMPLAIEWVSRNQGIAYPDFVYNPQQRADAYIACAKKYDFDCVLPDADFFEQLEDLGANPTFDGNAYSAPPIIEDLDEFEGLPQPQFIPGTRMGNRLEIIRRVAKAFKGEKYIFGICIGPFTEFCNARGVEDAMCDLLTDEEAALNAVGAFFENGMRFINAQLEAGADGIQIVEPCCSLISPALYEHVIMPLHKRMVERIQRDGGFARLHICGDTNKLLPFTLGTGTHILDVDSAVDVGKGAALLSNGQVFCGNLHPASDILDGKPEDFYDKVHALYTASGNRIIISGGCDIPPATPEENMIAFHDACARLGHSD